MTVQLWYSSNYHWFLKQELKFKDDSVSDLCWDGEHVLKFHILAKNGSYMSYQFCWEISRSRGHHVDNHSAVIMVDGGNIWSLLYFCQLSESLLATNFTRTFLGGLW